MKEQPSPSRSHVAHIVKNNQGLQRKYHGGKREKKFAIGEIVLYKHYYQNKTFKWFKGTIKNALGKNMYIVSASGSNTTYKKHCDHILEYKGAPAVPPIASSAMDDMLSTTSYTPPPPPPPLQSSSPSLQTPASTPSPPPPLPRRLALSPEASPSTDGVDVSSYSHERVEETSETHHDAEEDNNYVESPTCDQLDRPDTPC